MAPTISPAILKAGLTALKYGSDYVNEEALLNTLGAASNFEHALTLAWKAVTRDTIQHCWKKTGILPDTTAYPSSDDTPSNPLSDLEQFVSDSLDALEACGVLLKNSRVDLEDLVNSAAEMIEGYESSLTR